MESLPTVLENGQAEMESGPRDGPARSAGSTMHLRGDCQGSNTRVEVLGGRGVWTR